MVQREKEIRAIITNEKQPILVSACLLGVNCKYNGGNNANPTLRRLIKKQFVVPVCPEMLGGMPTPRRPQSISGGTGKEVLERQARVITDQREDVTELFLRGAEETWKLAQLFNCRIAIFKERSPSCGVHFIHAYDREGAIIPGEGVTTALLQKTGIRVLSDEELD